ncbi:hypothetical protein AAFF_G00236460 [Aldrovandia affinis]|uniref:Uncharacterized protein n=1 Tax=Aldrovandia affinis TaxID=143900 RepID=A0AAD7REE5_9TELE|nr:hypothetical protein AAFF_G00236460 [Aldrovandia affinis]
MAKVAKPLLGADFLRTNGLLVYVKSRRLNAINAEDFSSFPCILSGLPTTILSCALTVEQHIPTTGAPVHVHIHHLDPAKLAVAKAEFANIEHLGIVQRGLPSPHGAKA